MDQSNNRVAMDLPEDEQIEQYYRYAYVADFPLPEAASLFGFAKAEGLISARGWTW